MTKFLLISLLSVVAVFGQTSRPDFETPISADSIGATPQIDLRRYNCPAIVVNTEVYGSSSAAISATFQYAPANSSDTGPGTWTTYDGQVRGGSTSITTVLSTNLFLGAVPYFRINIASMTGKFRAKLSCWKSPFNVAGFGTGGAFFAKTFTAGDGTGTTPLDVKGTSSGAWIRFYQNGVLKGWFGAVNGGASIGVLDGSGNSSLWSCNITTLACVFGGRMQGITFKEAINTVTFSTTPVFNLALGNPFLTLTGSVSSSTLSNLTSGQRVTFTICQNASGNNTFVWPTAVKGGMTIGSTASRCNVQEFFSPDGSTLYATSAGVTNQ